MHIEYVSMHAIQRRMQAEGLGQEAVVEHLNPIARDARLNQMRDTWEPVIRRELAEATQLNPMQQFAISTSFRQRRGDIVASYWLTPGWLCYAISERQEVLTVFGIDNATADILESLGSPAKPKPKCTYKSCFEKIKDGSRFCKKHAGVGLEHEQRLEKRRAEAEKQFNQARLNLKALAAKDEARKRRIETRTPLRICAYRDSCSGKTVNHSFYCKGHIGIAKNEEMLLSLEISTAESTLDWAKSRLTEINEEIQAVFERSEDAASQDPSRPRPPKNPATKHQAT